MASWFAGARTNTGRPPPLSRRSHLSVVGCATGRRQAKLARSAGASPVQVRPSKPPGSECCVRRQQCRTRSVHSRCVGCVIEPRNTLVAGGGGCPLLPNATWAAPLCEAQTTLPGSKSTSCAKGSRRNLGDPTSGRRMRVRSRVPAVRIEKVRSRSR
jgi:hypothetical protein